MRQVTESQLGSLVASLPGQPRVLVGGNGATPRRLLEVLDANISTYRLFMLNPPHGIPGPDGVMPETPVVGPAMRRSATLSYVPARLSLVPRLFATTRP